MLQGRQFGNAFLRQFDEFGQFVEIKRRAFCRALDFDDFAFAVHHDVDVAVAARIFGIIQIQQRYAVYDADRYGGDAAGQRIFGNPAV